ncbi:SMP-30/gluconolactonase/LRE family protein [Adhaeribacter swui]|uniref:SMP-30/gluconolactonase/LRE family protein n=1 Tax=Adhaeribacter swui TaxID=2086471 RepID=A0A7G7GBE7_9BACT|nr:alpha/beta hydrolase-fold protein [Adhaeribacter swui]QNF34481.1 SMP-30/gluconolactonase/LRE family protein [Adhaeribacter swui]
MRRLLFLIFLIFSFKVMGWAQDMANKSYPYEPAQHASAEVPPGEVLSFEFNQSKLYPGTSRTYWVYIPKAYTPEKPACLFVCLDGVLFNAPTVFDYLISKKEMPVTIGVFIQAGTIKAKDGTVIRYNRTNEFDNMNDRFARFIEEEILPDVQKQKASDGRPIRISAVANDRAIAGASSGAICAFTAAWQRPDLYSRVFSAIGTYIGMRGGDQYPILARKTEPKPLRVYLQDNKNDTWNPLFGNWYHSNLNMEAALNFAGYEVTHTWQEGGHETKQATAIFADAMRWLWKAWPTPVKSGWSANNMLQTILDSTQTWQESTLNKPISKDPNNVIALPNGTRYTLEKGKINYRTKNKTRVVDQDQNLGNAIAISPDKKQLIASIKHSSWLYNYTVEPNGTLANKQKLYWLHNPGNEDNREISSMAFDELGNLYVATELGIQVCDQNGRVRAILPLPSGQPIALWFDQETPDFLFVKTTDKVYRRQLKVKGVHSTQEAVIPKSQGAG